MADILRAAAYVPGFLNAVEVWLVEASLRLQAVQKEALAGHAVRWADRVDDLPPGPLLLVANEFFDALPIEHYFHDKGNWYQRLIGFDERAGLGFVPGPKAGLGVAGRDGDIFETCPEGVRIARLLGRRLTREDGAALIIDYGHVRSAVGDTLQAVRGHKFHPVLQDPGDADVTAHVDFQALAEAAIPARALGPVTQGDFLRALGIETRAQMLAKGLPPEGAARIAADMRRLIDAGEMGTLFKVMALAHPARGSLIGF
jgi:SAM-dependent MidA family methyltransferase